MTAIPSRTLPHALPAALPAGVQRTWLGVALFVVLGMVMLGPYMTYVPPPATTDGNALRQVIYILAYALALAAIRVTERPSRLLVLPMSLTVLLGYCLISVLWALDPEIAIRRLILTTLITLTVFTVVEAGGYALALAVTRAVMILALFGNYAVVFVDPSLGIHQASEFFDIDLIGNWRGFMMQKNFTGAVCALTLIAFLFDARRVPALLRLMVLVATGFFLYKTSSKTSMGLLVLALALGQLYSWYNPRHRIVALLATGLAMLLAAAAIAAYWTEITARLADPTAFTGRTQIWSVLLTFARDHLLQGAGYGSFWNIGTTSPVFHYIGAKSWLTYITSGHNGYLDLLVQIGLPGLLLAVLALIVVPLNRLLVNLNIDRQSGGLVMATLLFCWFHNCTESSLLDRDSPVQVILVLGLAMVDVLARRVPAPETRQALAARPAHA